LIIITIIVLIIIINNKQKIFLIEYNISILEINSCYIRYIDIVLNDTEETVINLKSMIPEHYPKYLDIFGKVAAS
jgi:hypothetical protein